MKLRRFVQAAATCCFVLAGSVFASTITQTCTIPQTGVPFTQPCTLNDFNPATGTLTSVTLSLTGVGGDVIPEQTNTGTVSYTFTNSIATIGLSLVGPDSINVSETSVACSGTIAAGTTNTSCTPDNFSGLSAANVSGTIADYLGTGTISPVFTASGQILSASGSGGAGSAGHLFFGGDGTIGGTFTLTYTYTPAGTIPEPATMAMVGGAFLGLAVLARKRRK